MAAKTKIVLDADVIIHFIKGNRLAMLLDIFPEYDYIILNVVYDEVTVNHHAKIQIDNTLNFFRNRLSLVTFNPKGTSRLEYARLIASLGHGESACMVFCRDNSNVLGSSNLRDIKLYCEQHRITYLTTLDFLYYAYIRKKMTTSECSQFIQDVITKGSKLPDIDIATYVPSCRI